MKSLAAFMALLVLVPIGMLIGASLNDHPEPPDARMIYVMELRDSDGTFGLSLKLIETNR